MHSKQSPIFQERKLRLQGHITYPRSPNEQHAKETLVQNGAQYSLCDSQARCLGDRPQHSSWAQSQKGSNSRQLHPVMSHPGPALRSLNYLNTTVEQTS